MIDDPRAAVELDAGFADEVLLSSVSGIGPKTRMALLEQFTSATAVLNAAPSALRSVSGVGPKLVQAILAARGSFDVAALLDECRRHEVAIYTPSSTGYPRPLRDIHDPPGVLYARGALLERDALAVAIVGSRHATQYGLKIAEQLAGGLARTGLTIISGLARGIDTAAHRGALEAGGRTIGVLGSGVLNIYPPEHVSLAEAVIQSGAILSEAPLHGQPTTGSFPQRNRLITGLSLGTIVVEAADRSGALISARLADEQGRTVMAVPGRLDSRMSSGCHALIRDGAVLVRNVDDVIESLGHLAEAAQVAVGQTVHHPAELTLNEVEQTVLNAVDTQATSLDAVAEKAKLPIHQVLATLSVLEMRRLIRRVSGSLVIRL